MKHDEAYKWTEEQLAELESRIADEYAQVAKDLEKKAKEYFEKFKKRDADMMKLVDAGRVTPEEYKQWRLAQIGRGKRFEKMAEEMAERITQANEIVADYINDVTPLVYARNRNYTAYTIEQVSGSVDFTMIPEDSVKILFMKRPDLMPFYPPERAVKRGIDLEYGKRQITKQTTTGILQGEKLGELADRLQTNIPTMSRNSAIRAARTAATGAQNAGRVDACREAKELGLNVKQRWIATLDGRTRHEHGELDGQVVEVGKPFKVDGYELRFPGDPQGKPHLVYNCRCSLIADYDEESFRKSKRRARDIETGEKEIITGMTYSEWVAEKEAKATAKELEEKMRKRVKERNGADTRGRSKSPTRNAGKQR